MPQVIPRAAGHWLLGNLREIQKAPLRFLRDLHEKHGDVSVHRLGPFDYYLIAHPDGVKRVLQDNHPNYSKRVSDVQAIGYLTGDGVLVTDGANWMRRRRLMQPAFHRDRVAAMMKTMAALSESWLESWETAPPQGWHNASEAIARLTVSIASQTLFSLDLDAGASEVMDSFTQANALLVRRFRAGRFFAPFPLFADDREFLRQRSRLDAVIDRIIAERRAAPREEGADLLSLLMEARDEEDGGFLSDEDLRAEIKTLLLAGFETTSNALTWAFFYLGRYPLVADRLAAEANAVLGDRSPEAGDLPQLVEIRAFLEETMRMHPPAWYTARRAEQADELAGFPIPRGARIVISPYLLHRHPRLWVNPDAFDAARFLPGKREGAHRFSYFPFGAGPRQCIGNQFAMAEALIILSLFVRRYHMELRRPEEPAAFPLITLRMRDDLAVRVVRR